MDPFNKHCCSFCSEPSMSFIGPEDQPYAYFCFDHDKRFTRANAKDRGRMLERAGISLRALSADRTVR